MIIVLAFAGIVVSLMQTLVIPLVPALPRLLDAPAADTAWAITATLLAGAVATPVAGRLGDMYGKRRMLLGSLALLVVGSTVCGLSDSVLPMIVGRALQGFAAGVIPLGISIMRDELPAERLGSATALMSASLGVGDRGGQQPQHPRARHRLRDRSFARRFPRGPGHRSGLGAGRARGRGLPPRARPVQFLR